MTNTLALDRGSVRSFDPDGRLHVATSNISRAAVNPYYGSEIPDCAAMGLTPDKVYMLLRDPAELAKSVSTFNNLPLLSRHAIQTASDPMPDLVIGSTGSNAAFDGEHLTNSLVVWSDAAIAGIETGQQQEISCGYRYTPDMTPGVYQGIHYDGRMTRIHGSHVALVEIGRAGPSVVVGDSQTVHPDQNPFNKDPKMKHKQRLIAAKADARKALSGVIAQDADLTALDTVLAALAMDAESDEDKNDKKDEVAEDESDDELYEDDPDAPGKRRKKVAAAADAEEDMKAPEVTKAAMDSAIASAVSKATARVKADMEALHIARKEVAPMVGEIALDSAEAVYKFALDHAGVDVAGVHPSAYRALVKMAGAEKTKPAATLGMDAAAAKKAAEQFPHLSRFGK